MLHLQGAVTCKCYLSPKYFFKVKNKMKGRMKYIYLVIHLFIHLGDHSDSENKLYFCYSLIPQIFDKCLPCARRTLGSTDTKVSNRAQCPKVRGRQVLQEWVMSLKHHWAMASRTVPASGTFLGSSLSQPTLLCDST